MGGDISGNGSAEDLGIWDTFDSSRSGDKKQSLEKPMTEEEKREAVEKRKARQKSSYSALENVIAMRNPSAWVSSQQNSSNRSGLRQKTSFDPLRNPPPDASSTSTKHVLAPAEEAAVASVAAVRKSQQPRATLGAKKLVITPNFKCSSTGTGTKAEVGSAIDLRKLQKAKKVQVFRGPGRDIMVVGRRRLVVIVARRLF